LNEDGNLVRQKLGMAIAFIPSDEKERVVTVRPVE